MLRTSSFCAALHQSARLLHLRTWGRLSQALSFLMIMPSVMIMKTSARTNSMKPLMTMNWMIPVMMTMVILRKGSTRPELDMDLVYLKKDIGLVVAKVSMIMVVTPILMTMN
uniref:Uncharacterized protein n=1 Tax=Arundo donax TaxID=35708 RepID=A0A0A9HGR9_ARUDO